MMEISKQATKGHLIVGSILIFIAFASAIVAIAFKQPIMSLAVFFFGVWGGVEVGRYLELFLQNQDE
jgi:hypothetical protein